MKVITRLIFMNDENEKFFGEGPYRLLQKVEETGSLHAAAGELGMAYSKATKLLKNAEASLGFSLTVRKIGGKSGGGSVLTREAKEFMQRYEAYRDACLESNATLYEKYFGDEKDEAFPCGCVIMASGLGKRFGGDKLMVELLGKPMLQYIVEATENLFAARVVVTRNAAVKEWCEARKIPVVFHSLPDRNDTVRLGINALEEACGKDFLSGCVFCPADMPLVSAQLLGRLLDKAKEVPDGIVRVAHKDKVAAPVFFANNYFLELKSLSKGSGGSEVIKAHPAQIHLVETKEKYEILDIDTKEDYGIIEEIMKKSK